MIMQTDYKSKYFSILGDSISTLAGYNPQGYEVFYKWDKMLQAGIFEAKDTWWGKVIDELGGKLLINANIRRARLSHTAVVILEQVISARVIFYPMLL